MLVQLFYWGTNQAIIQRALAAKNLREGQKGLMLAAFIKILGPIIVVLPGIIAWHMFQGDLENADQAYPALVNAVLPPVLFRRAGVEIQAEQDRQRERPIGPEQKADDHTQHHPVVPPARELFSARRDQRVVMHLGTKHLQPAFVRQRVIHRQKNDTVTPRHNEVEHGQPQLIE